MGQMGFFTDTTLCIGCKACEVACKQWNQLPSDGYAFTGHSYDNTVELSATTWRHVAFIEHSRPADGTGKAVNWLMMSDVCKHCTHAGCMEACPTGAIIRNEFGDVYVQPDICNGCGYYTWIVAGRGSADDPQATHHYNAVERRGSFGLLEKRKLTS